MTGTFADAPVATQLRALAGQLRHDAVLTNLDTPETAGCRLRHYAELLDQAAAALTTQETP